MRQAYSNPSSWTLGFALFVVTLCITPMAFLDGVLVRTVGHALPVWISVAGLVNLLGTLLHIALARLCSESGEGGADRAAHVLQGLLLVAGAGLMVSAWVGLVRSTTLPETPSSVLALLMVSVVVYTILQGAEAAIRVVSIIGVASLATLIVPLILIGANSRPEVLSPITVVPPEPWALPALLFAPRGYVILGALAGPKALRSPGPMMGLSAISVTVMGVSLLLGPAVLGWGLARHLTFPFFVATGTVSSVYFPFHRIEFLVDIVWQLLLTGVVISFLTAALRLLGDSLRPRTVDWRAVSVGAAALLISTAKPTVATSTSLFTAWSVLGLMAFIALPGLLYLGRLLPLPRTRSA